jgi:putative FmdB family regulatory protein
MPTYEFVCHHCEKRFSADMHISEHERDVPKCPSCHRKDGVEKLLSTFTAVTSHKSA